MDKGSGERSKKGYKEGNILVFDPHYVFNIVWQTDDLVEFDPYDPQLKVFKEGAKVALKTIDGDYYRGIMTDDYKKNRIKMKIITHEKINFNK